MSRYSILGLRPDFIGSTVIPVEQLLLFLLSLVANAFSAFAGGGAGLLQLPVLIFLGLPFGVALATHKVASVALGVGATIRHMRQNTLERYLCCLSGCGLPGVVLGASVILRLSDRSAEFALGCLTVALGLYSWFKPRLGQEFSPRNRSGIRLLLGGMGLFASAFSTVR